MSKDILTLTDKDAANYIALCNAVHDRKIRRSTDRKTTKDRLTPAQKLSKLTEQNYCCDHCGEPFENQNSGFSDATMDHVIRFCYGGEANRHNIVLVHRDCNYERSKMNDIEIIESHYGPIDMGMIINMPVVSFDKPRRAARS